MKKVIFEHWKAYILALIVGLVMILPSILSIKNLGEGEFKGIYPILSDDESHYMTMIKESYDGHIKMSNPYIKEYKQGSYTQPPLASMYYANFAKVLSVSIGVGALINDFMLPFLAVLLLYFLIFRLTDSKRISALSSLLYFTFFINLFNRPVNPQFSFVFLLLGFHLIISIINNKHTNKKLFLYNFLLAIVFGILVYVYPFYWMTIGVLYAGMTICQFWEGKDYLYLLKNWFSFLIPALLLSVPFLVNFRSLVKNPLFDETMIRNGYIYTYIPGAFLSLAPLLFCIFILLILQKIYKFEKDWKNYRNMFLGWTFIIGGLLLNWQNIFSGVTIQFTSHLYPVSILFVLIICAISLSKISFKTHLKSLSYQTVLIGLIAVILSGVLYIQKNSIVATIKDIRSPKDISALQNLAGPMEWFNLYSSEDSAILTFGKDYDWAIPVYTKNNIYFINYAGIFMMSDAELEKRWVVNNFFDKVDYSAIWANRDIWLDKYIDTYQSKEVRRKLLQQITRKTYPKTVLMDDESIERVLNTYKNFQKEGFEKALKIYEVDYIIVDGNDKVYSELPTLFKKYYFLQLVASIGGSYIYEVK